MLSLSEFLMHEPTPLYQVHEAIFEFCRGRKDVVVFGAQAVNAHVPEPRMTQDVDLLTPDAKALAEQLANALGAKLHIAARVREVAGGRGYRVYQLRKEGNRHLADVRRADLSTDVLERDGVRFTGIVSTTAMKIVAYTKRRASPKGATDLADLRRLLIAHPELRSTETGVVDVVREHGGEDAVAAWAELLEQPLSVDDEDAGY